jgi:hypothetical protein
MMRRLVQLYPTQVRESESTEGTHEILDIAARAGAVEVVEKLLEDGAKFHSRKQLPSALWFTIYPLVSDPSRGFHPDPLAEELAFRIRITQLLLQNGWSIYEIPFGEKSIAHLAVEWPALLECLVEHTIQLEAKGLLSSTQRLLRMRDHLGRTPEDCCIEGVTATFLREQLRAAESRDGMIMYDVDYPDIKKGVDLRKAVLLYKSVKGNGYGDTEGRLYNAGLEYLEWLKKRRQELEQQYKAKEKEISEDNSR